MVMLIAEIGVNHNGCPELLEKLINEAKDSGADDCKFQTFKADRLAKKSTPKVRYQLATSGFKDNYQSKLGALPRYTPGNLNDNLDRYFKDYRDFKLKSALAYYQGQLCGWHDISIPDADIFLSKRNWSEIIDDLVMDVMSVPVTKDA